MQLRFVGQPFSEHPNLVDFIEHARDGGFDDLRIAVAWAKRSGLGRVYDALAKFREQGGKITLVVGVSEGGATKEGLQLALDLADRSYVFHDPQRTFHPKVYFASSSDQRSLLVGSSNMTAGGLSWNYEASIWVDWGSDEGDDVASEITAWFDRLISEPDSCKPLSLDLIGKLERSKDIVLGSEARARRFRRANSDAPEDNDSSLVGTISGLFKPIRLGLRKLPFLSEALSNSATNNGGVSGVPPKRTKVTSIGDASPPALAGPAPLPSDNIRRRWIKRLDNTAAQQVRSVNSNPTGNLRLSQESAEIDHKRYFREDFFGGLPWAPTEDKDHEQEVLIGFHTWIDGNDYGLQDLRVSHDPRRISGQGNVPTVIHWGTLSPALRSTNYVGLFVSIERTEGGKFNLVISQDPRGDFKI